MFSNASISRRWLTRAIPVIVTAAAVPAALSPPVVEAAPADEPELLATGHWVNLEELSTTTAIAVMVEILEKRPFEERMEIANDLRQTPSFRPIADLIEGRGREMRSI